MSRFVACAILALGLASCSSGGSDGGGTTTPPAPAAGSATITGTVSGTVISVLNAMTDQVISQFDTASLNQPPPFPFSIANVPTGVPLRIFFVTGGAVYPLYLGATNVFTFTSGGTVSLGQVDTANEKATPATVPTNVTLGQDKPIPPTPTIVIPPTASISVTIPSNGAQVQGSDVAIKFSLQNFTIGNQNHTHLHVYLGNDPIPYEFLNGFPSGQVLYNGNPAPDAQWVTGTEIRFRGLSNATHSVQFKLSTASNAEYVNPEASTSVLFTVNPPPPAPPTISVTSPTNNQHFPIGPVTVAFNATNFAIQGQGQSQLHFYLEGNTGNLYQFLSGPNQVLLNGSPATDIDQVTSSSFRFTALSPGSHSLQLVLANGDAAITELTNPQATDIVPFTVDAPPVASVAVISGTSFQSSPVSITFSVAHFMIGLPGNPHLRFSIDGGLQHDFYNGAGIDSNNGVLLNGVHDHAVHWTSTTSFNLFGLPAGNHQVRLALVDASNAELPGTSVTHNFNVQQPPVGELQLESVLSGIEFPVGLAQAPDGRIFFNERLTGATRVINPNWQLDPTSFCEVQIQLNGEQGLLGLALDPAFSSSNEAVYVYYTASVSGKNRVSKLTRSGGVCTEAVILDSLPTSTNHNGGIIQFGPDGKLYVVIGDAQNPSNAQDINSLAGKILRVNPNGSAPPDNPFYVNGTGNRDKIFSRGHRNSFGFTFHPQTGDLWESENGLSDFDEVNRVTRGSNYGWDSSLQSGFLNRQCCVNPIIAFPIIAPTGIIAIPGNSVVYPPAYRNNLLVAAYNDGTIRLVIPNASNLDQPGSTSVAFTGGQGALISLMLGTDGYVYVSNGIFTPFDGSSIFRVVPH